MMMSCSCRPLPRCRWDLFSFFPSLPCFGAHLLNSGAKSDEAISPMRVCVSEIVFRDKRVRCVELKPYEPLVASVTLLDGPVPLIVQTNNVERIGFRAEGLIGQKGSDIFGVLWHGKVMERMFVSPPRDPILTLMSIARTETTVVLDFEIVDHQYALEFVIDGDGTIRDCSHYSARPLTGHSREQLIGQHINIVVPELFPIFPVAVKFGCQAVHRDGHPFRVTIVLFETESGRYCCQLRRHIVGLPKNVLATTRQMDDLIEVTDLLHLGPVLGSGAFGAVRLGRLRDNMLQYLTVKFVLKAFAGMALREAEILTLVQHQYILQWHTMLETPTYFVIVTTFCPGIIMSDYIRSRPVVMIVEEARHYLGQLVSAVGYLHSMSIVHRDISLHNIIVNAVGSTSLQWHKNSIRLIDFGLSCRFEHGRLLGTFCGSPAFASPEIWLREPYEGPDADIWAMGVVLYCCLVGVFPFATMQDVCKQDAVDCSKIDDTSCVDLVEKMLTKKVAERATMAQIMADPWLIDHFESF